ncbi:hypothetical protein BJ912DRAFT_1144505 [Pholiota molesta]|nr:hypothetical protein BJ912DRAFT_1144505 [Pholiota molesta]
MRAYIFSNQGWRSFICSLVTVQGLLRAGLFRACFRLHCSAVITATNAFLLPSSPPLCSDIALLGHCSAPPLLLYILCARSATPRAEVFPTRFRAFAHGISAAMGKVGAIVSALAFNTLSQRIGTPAILWIFFGCWMLGALFTLLLPEVKGCDPG